MKRLFILLPILAALFMFTGCSKDNDGEATTSEKKEWLDNNIVGTWKAVKLWNDISYIWVNTSLGWPDATFKFNSDGTVEITDFNVDEGISDYNIIYEDYSTYIVINGYERMVTDLDVSEKSMTLLNYVQLKKID